MGVRILCVDSSYERIFNHFSHSKWRLSDKVEKDAQTTS